MTEEKKTQMTRKIYQKDSARCPHCDSIDYARRDYDAIDDAMLFDCECFTCGKEFKETFLLCYQDWEVEGDEDGSNKQ